MEVTEDYTQGWSGENVCVRRCVSIWTPDFAILIGNSSWLNPDLYLHTHTHTLSRPPTPLTLLYHCELTETLSATWRVTALLSLTQTVCLSLHCFSSAQCLRPLLTHHCSCVSHRRPSTEGGWPADQPSWFKNLSHKTFSKQSCVCWLL